MAANTKMKQFLAQYAKQSDKWAMMADGLVKLAREADGTRTRILALATGAKNKAKTEAEKAFWNIYEGVATNDLKPSRAAGTIASSYAKSIDKDHKAVLKGIADEAAAAKKAIADAKAKVIADKKAQKLADAKAKKDISAAKQAAVKAKQATEKAAAAAKALAVKEAKKPAAKKPVAGKAAAKTMAADLKKFDPLPPAKTKTAKAPVGQAAEKAPEKPKAAAKPKAPKQVTLTEAIKASEEPKTETKGTEKTATSEVTTVKTTGPDIDDLLAQNSAPPTANA